MPRAYRTRRLAEALDVVESVEGAVDVVLLPPEGGDGVVSDTEDGDEDLLPVEGMRMEIPNEVTGDIEVVARDQDEEEEVSGHSSLRWRKNRATLTKVVEPGPPVQNIRESHPELIDLEPVELFRKLFDAEMKGLITTETLRYAQQNNIPLDLDAGKLEKFIGVILLTGYNIRKRQRLYWSRDDDVKCELVPRAFSRKGFEDIKRCFHLANNNDLPKGNKMAKVQPLYDQLNRSLVQFGVFEESLSIDEQMVPYYGHHSCKMAMRLKPIRFGYKLWVLCTASGYPVMIIIYQGKAGPTEVREGIPKGLGALAVVQLLECLPDPTAHKVTFDNFFTSADLMTYLSSKGIRASGTARDNRLRSPPFPSVKEAEKAKRGTYWAVSTPEILAVKWRDNRAVTLVTNHESVHPMQSANRWCREKRLWFPYHNITLSRPTIKK